MVRRVADESRHRVLQYGPLPGDDGVMESGMGISQECDGTQGQGHCGSRCGGIGFDVCAAGPDMELGALLKSVEGRVFTGPATERITEAREGLWMMETDPGVSFRCGPLALHRIQLALDPKHVRTDLVLNAKSTQDGFSLPQVVKLSEEMGLNYRAAFREPPAKSGRHSL